MTAKTEPEFDRDRIALGIQQPWAELILRGIKTLEIRSQPTRQRGRIYLYASKRLSSLPAAESAAHHEGISLENLPLGLLVGSVEIFDCRKCRRRDHNAACVPAELLIGQYAWVLANPQRFAVPKSVRFLPYGVWFYPFKRRSSSS